MSLPVALWIAAVGQVVVALLHGIFPRLFRWREELAPLSLLTRQLFLIHTLFVALTVALLGIVTAVLAATWSQPSSLLRLAVLGALVVFWGTRLFVQLFVFDRQLWSGHRTRTLLHWLALATWSSLTATYAWAFWSSLP